MRSQKFKLSILLPLVGPLLLLALWELAISAKWVKPVLLPPPGDTLIFLWESLISGAINIDLLATLRRTIYAFGVATIIGVPLGIALGSSRNIYRSVEFLVDFFRSTPSSALIPLFLLIFGITDLKSFFFLGVGVFAFTGVAIYIKSNDK